MLTDRGPRPDEAGGSRERIRERLFAARERRERPVLDDKRLTSWNALMITRPGRRRRRARVSPSTSTPRSPAPSSSCAICAIERGRLLRTYNDGHAKIDAYLEDHAFLLEALIVLFEASCEERWFQAASELAEEMIARFAGPRAGRLLLDRLRR